MSVEVEDIKKLRESTGAGIMDAKSALEEAGGDFNKAVEILRKKGLAKAAKKADRVAKNGLIECYVHGGQIGVLVEINCETDFVARTNEFKNFAHDIAMHIAAADPLYLSRGDIPEDVIEKEKTIIMDSISDDNRQAAYIDKIISGKLEKWQAEVCLLQQPFVKDPDQTIEDLTKSMVAKLGENIVIKRFVRFKLGGQ